MQEDGSTAIAAKKRMALTLILVSLPFTAIILWVLFVAAGSTPELKPGEHPYERYVYILLGLLFFGSGVVFGLWMLFDRRPALVLSRTGIHDGSSGTGFEFVPWSDITGFGTFKAGRHNTLVLFVADPEKYLQAKSWFGRLLQRLSVKSMGSPVCINDTLLKVRFDEFTKTVQEYHRRYGPHAGISRSPSAADDRFRAPPLPTVQRSHR